jgi:hypothetical protein
MLLSQISEGGLIAWSNLKTMPCAFVTGGFGEDQKLRVYNFEVGQRKSQPVLVG